jgi:predicted CXXCH cytochrome family protein
LKRFTLLGIIALGAVIAGAGLLARAGPTEANGGPHGNYTLTTSSCAGCHRAHTAVGPDLLKSETIFGLCTTCHSGGLAQTDVIHGRQDSTGKTLNGGGFEQVNGEPVSSSHTVEDLPVGGTPATGDGTAWGSQDGVGDGGVGVQGKLECTSCHNPHGSTNYRILRDASTTAKWVSNDPDLLNWVSYQVLATRDDAPNYAYDLTSQADCPPNPSTPGPGTKCLARYTSGVQSVSGQPSIIDPVKGMNAFCATCHKSYLTMSGGPGFNSLNTPEAPVGPGTPTRIPAVVYPGTQDALDGHGDIARFRHSVGRTKGSPPKQPLRFAARGNDPNPLGALTYDAMGCLTCHYAHGTNAAATPAPGESIMPGPAADSALLFYGNRGVCISCHQTVGSVPTVTPVPTNTPVPP